MKHMKHLVVLCCIVGVVGCISLGLALNSRSTPIQKTAHRISPLFENISDKVSTNVLNIKTFIPKDEPVMHAVEEPVADPATEQAPVEEPVATQSAPAQEVPVQQPQEAQPAPTTTPAPSVSQEPNDTYAAEAMQHINNYRVQHGLAPLVTGLPGLKNFATIRANQIMTNFSHQGADACSAYTGYYLAGENLAKGYNSGYKAFVAWTQSGGHNQVLLGADAVYGEVAVAFDVYGNAYYALITCRNIRVQ